jgi:hypothetical protein
MFLHPMVSVGHVVHCGASRAQNINTLFFLLVGGQYGFLKEHAGTRYAEHAFLHPVVSVGHVAHSGVFGARNVNALYFMLEWDWCCFHKKHVRTSYTIFCFCIRWDMQVTLYISVRLGRKKSTLYFSCSCGIGTESTKSVPGHVTPNLYFASTEICGSRSALRCVRGVKHRRTIFLARVVPVGIPQKACWDTLLQSCAFASEGLCGSRCAFQCIDGAKHRCTIFHDWLG